MGLGSIRRGGRRHKRTSYRGVVARGLISTLAGLEGEDGRGLRTIKTVCPIASTEGIVGRYTIRPVLGKANYQELKANAECLHVETGSPILTEEQLMCEVVGGSNKGHIHGFGSQSTAVTAERRGGSSNSMCSVLSCGVQLDSLTTLFPPFPPPDSDATS
ncbi:hypothetical protein M9H77_08815 [Catharanthus roseus]|uniref:Uncharacterized protein n=1 Tax=Catharanthus roseus TaxID=4058 RepID=A0ACC0BZ03_CATRO|nr:hypothetical protein M9H77_08815 [Catharanthus roseus]